MNRSPISQLRKVKPELWRGRGEFVCGHSTSHPPAGQDLAPKSRLFPQFLTSPSVDGTMGSRQEKNVAHSGTWSACRRPEIGKQASVSRAAGRGQPTAEHESFSGGDFIRPSCPSPKASLIQSQGCQQQDR